MAVCQGWRCRQSVWQIGMVCWCSCNASISSVWLLHQQAHSNLPAVPTTRAALISPSLPTLPIILPFSPASPSTSSVCGDVGDSQGWPGDCPASATLGSLRANPGARACGSLGRAGSLNFHKGLPPALWSKCWWWTCEGSWCALCPAHISEATTQDACCSSPDGNALGNAPAIATLPHRHTSRLAMVLSSETYSIIVSANHANGKTRLLIKLAQHYLCVFNFPHILYS